MSGTDSQRALHTVRSFADDTQLYLRFSLVEHRFEDEQCIAEGGINR